MIVDDHPAVREALAARIGRQSDLEVCGEAADVAEALALAVETEPDLAVVDIALKTGNGIDLIKRIFDHTDRIRVLVWSTYGETIYAERALRAGALGYVSKDHATDKILEAIRHVLEGKVYLSEPMAAKMLQRSVGRKPGSASPSPADVLSDREIEVFRMIGQGIRTAEIAKQLQLSVKTVETYRDRIRHKLSLNHGTELVHYATRWLLESQ